MDQKDESPTPHTLSLEVASTIQPISCFRCDTQMTFREGKQCKGCLRMLCYHCYPRGGDPVNGVTIYTKIDDCALRAFGAKVCWDCHKQIPSSGPSNPPIPRKCPPWTGMERCHICHDASPRLRLECIRCEKLACTFCMESIGTRRCQPCIRDCGNGSKGTFGFFESWYQAGTRSK